MATNYSRAKSFLLLSMVLFGTVGLFVRGVSLPSALLALCRGCIGAPVLLLYAKLTKQPCRIQDIRGHAGKLLLIGACLGVNWVLLFEAYRFTTVAAATLGYYMAPVFVLMLSPILFKEKRTGFRSVCILCALLGMVLLSGILSEGGIVLSKGLLFSLGAACFYAAVVLLGKTVRGVPPLTVTVTELLTSAMVLLPYVLVTGQIKEGVWNVQTVLLTAVIGTVHTGACYALYFSALPHVRADEAALMSYVDPAVSVLLSAIVLKEALLGYEIAGGILILLSTFLAELFPHKPLRFHTGEERALIDNPDPVSFYNGIPVIRHPFTHFTSCASPYCVWLNRNHGRNRRYYADENTVRHEYGHILQAKELGFFRFWRYIAVPSLSHYIKKVPYAAYYNQPWERGADLLGNAERKEHTPESEQDWMDYRERIMKKRKMKKGENR